MATIQQLRALIAETHAHGVKLNAEIADLRKRKPPGWVHQVAIKRALEAGLKALNAKRRVELAVLEHKPAPKPPAPKPPPPKPKPTPPAPRFTMFDSTNVGNIPWWAAAVAGYVNGSFANYGEVLRAFP